MNAGQKKDAKRNTGQLKSVISMKSRVPVIIGIVFVISIAGCVQDETPETGQLCEPDKFPSPPADLDEILYILPMGGTHGDHVAPVDHIYLIEEHAMEPGEPRVEVYSPQDGVITHIQHMGSFQGDQNTDPFDDYYVMIKHSCGLTSIFIHIDRLSPKVAAVAPAWGGSKSVNVPLEAGEIIGIYSGSLDYLIQDSSVTNNLINPDSYKSFPERLNVQDPLPYFEESVRTRLIGLSVRTEEPIGGLIDYDVDGTLLGTWFREGTNGWAGLNHERYWADHLAIVYDELDPDHVVISIGTYTGDYRGQTGKSAQFGVKGNSPDPAEVTTATGLVKYELNDYNHYDGDKQWDYSYLAKGVKARNYEIIEGGVMLFELIEDRKLKVEIFPDKKANEVMGFTDNAKIYVR